MNKTLSARLCVISQKLVILKLVRIQGSVFWWLNQSSSTIFTNFSNLRSIFRSGKSTTIFHYLINFNEILQDWKQKIIFDQNFQYLLFKIWVEFSLIPKISWERKKSAKLCLRVWKAFIQMKKLNQSSFDRLKTNSTIDLSPTSAHQKIRAEISPTPTTQANTGKMAKLFMSLKASLNLSQQSFFLQS